jgi:hypothetical protein
MAQPRDREVCPVFLVCSNQGNAGPLLCSLSRVAPLSLTLLSSRSFLLHASLFENKSFLKLLVEIYHPEVRALSFYFSTSIWCIVRSLLLLFLLPVFFSYLCMFDQARSLSTLFPSSFFWHLSCNHGSYPRDHASPP